MVNEDHEPSDIEETVLEVLKAEQRVNPLLIRESTDLPKQRVYEALKQLNAAGWVNKVNRGLYEFVDDPRDDA